MGERESELRSFWASGAQSCPQAQGHQAGRDECIALVGHVSKVAGDGVSQERGQIVEQLMDVPVPHVLKDARCRGSDRINCFRRLVAHSSSYLSSSSLVSGAGWCDY